MCRNVVFKIKFLLKLYYLGSFSTTISSEVNSPLRPPPSLSSLFLCENSLQNFYYKCFFFRPPPPVHSLPKSWRFFFQRNCHIQHKNCSLNVFISAHKKKLYRLLLCWEWQRKTMIPRVVGMMWSAWGKIRHLLRGKGAVSSYPVTSGLSRQIRI